MGERKAGRVRASATVAETVGHTASRAASAAPALALPPYQTVALVLQGGGALGAYQAGVYEGLHEAGIVPNWIAGISIGAINTALIAGNAPEHRVAKLKAFWDTVCQPAYGFALPPAVEEVCVPWPPSSRGEANSYGMAAFMAAWPPQAAV